MFHACVERFDVIGKRGNILGWDGEVNKALTGPDRNRSGPVRPVTAVNRGLPSGFFNPGHGSRLCSSGWRYRHSSDAHACTSHIGN
jgi:hypothetical protein